MTLVGAFIEICKSYADMYFAVGAVSMGLLRLFTCYRDRNWRANQAIWDKALRRPDQVTPWQETALTWLKNAALLIFVLLFWPLVVPALLYELAKGPTTYKEPDPADQFECKPHCLRKKTTPKAAEAESMLTDPKGRVPDVPFGHLHEGWLKFLNSAKPGFDLWTFTVEGEEPYSPADVPWVQRSGRRRGLAWVYEGRVKAEFLTEWG